MKREELYNYAESILKRYLEDHGMRLTAERKVLLQFIMQYDTKTFSISNLMKDAEKEGIYYNTVKSFLYLLADAQIIVPTDTSQRTLKTSEYQLIINNRGTDRIRLICRKCGRVSTAKDSSIKLRMLNRSFNNFNMHYYTMYVYGQCVVCRRSIVKKNNKDKE